MTFAEIIFIFLAVVTVAGGLVTVLSRSLIYALIGLISTMFGIAGLYVYLDAPFLAVMQILIYVGAIAILIAFAVMLTGPYTGKPKPGEWTTLKKFIGALLVSGVTFAIFMKVILSSFPARGVASEVVVNTKDIGRLLFDRYALPFELISFLIVVSIIGAIMLAMFSKGEK